ncbi:wax ester/triacylglycerol synthase family O-acyltransferase [Iodidimonas sp. SYSU 1G8]|uniref:WS/DGAT/MGAT family O-acyltransferase n=1 Tax=Iodidimonas sp. SYSU 1G8 TaxID=3133967 RepID=UPI0031FE56A7
MEQLSPLDASFLYTENERVANHIGGLYIYDQSTVPGGMLRFRQILRYLESHIHKGPRYRQKLANVPLNLDHPYWVDDSRFDIEYHVRHLALPKPGDWRQLCILVSRLHDRPLDLSRPLWTMDVIEGLDNVEGLPPGSFAIVTKLHHAAIDGVSSVSMNTAIHETEPGLRLGTPEPWTPETEPTPMELLGRAHMNNLAQPMRLLKLMAESVPASARYFLTLGEENLRMDLPAGQVPSTRFNREISGRRVFNGISFDLADLRAIKDALPGATINDVVLALGGGALRRYLLAKNELPDEPLITMAPISVRTRAATAMTTGNEVTAMLASLGTHIADPRQRLEAVRASTSNSKALTNAIGARLLTDFQQLLPATTNGVAAQFLAQMRLANGGRPLFNTVMTNVPGPQHPLYFAGARLVNQYGLGIVQDGLGLFHTILSYDGKLTITAISDRDMMPDPEFYMSCFRDAFDELKAAMVPPSPPRPRVRKPATSAAE